MRTKFLLISVFTMLLYASAAVAQVSSRPKSSTTTTTTTTTRTTVSGPEHNIEGCVVSESGDFFLIPERGQPFKLQATANQNLSAQEGHKVVVKGKELSASASGQSSAAPASAGNAANGTGDDLHRLANRQLVADNIRSVADTCPVNWNPATRSRRK